MLTNNAAYNELGGGYFTRLDRKRPSPQRLSAPPGTQDPISASMTWALERLAAPLTLTEMARAAHLAPRTYQRRFTATVGLPPIKWLISQRIAASLPLLEAPDLPVEKVAAAVGFDSPVTYRHHFAKAMHTSPSAYRKAFR